jgi:hypothetical protein
VSEKYKWVQVLVATTEAEVAQWVGGCSLKSINGKHLSYHATTMPIRGTMGLC